MNAFLSDVHVVVYALVFQLIVREDMHVDITKNLHLL